MLGHVAIFLAAAVIAVPIFKRFGLGSVLGYLAAGVAIGPSGLGIMLDVDETLHFAEFGVVLLLFVIGLELQPSRLWRMRNAVFGLGGAQVAATTAVIAIGAVALGVPTKAAIVIGVALAMSSTAFAMQVLAEKKELNAPHGRAAFGILLFQDLAAIPILAVVPLLGEGGTEERSPWITFAIGAGVIVALVIGGRFLLRPAFRFVARSKSHELSVASALLVVVATAVLMEAVGLSMALGAFIAGVLLADSEYRHELESNIEPFKGLFLGLFFIAVGMSADLAILVDRPLVVIGLAFALVALKFAILWAMGRVFGQDRRSSTSLGVAISQGGEFAFVIFTAALGANVMEAETAALLTVVVTLSMGFTPLLFIARDVIEKRTKKVDARPFDAIDEEGQVVIAGFGRFGQIVARILRVRGIPFTALDASPEHVDFVRRFGNKIYYGDASRVELLRAARVDRARVFVLAIDEFEASMRTLAVVQTHFPHVKIVARARNRQHAYALLGAGVETVIRETFLDSLEAARSTLEALGTDSETALGVVQKFARYDEEMVRKLYMLREDQAALIESAKKYSAELERIFDQDRRVEAASEAPVAPAGAVPKSEPS
jgi:monovalent cation:proton antiporter-2 (CPA2) family protein